MRTGIRRKAEKPEERQGRLTGRACAEGSMKELDDRLSLIMDYGGGGGGGLAIRDGLR